MAETNKSSTAEAFKTAAIAGLIALAIRTVAYEPFNIPSGSMIPTLLVGDYLFVSKFSYGYSKHSLPFSHTWLFRPLPRGRILSSEPERGDIVVFKLPSDEQTDYIKRVIGLPGDRVQMKGGILHLNGEAVKRERIEDYLVHDDSGNVTRERQYRETLPNGRSYNTLELSDNEYMDNTSEYTIPADSYFAMGNNRDNSRDSRFREVGFIPRENLVGRAEFLFFSIDGAFWKFWEWHKTIRFDRLFTRIR
jgi:signal peptidase I